MAKATASNKANKSKAKVNSSKVIDITQMLANENIVDTDVAEEVTEATLTYSLTTITDRALPYVEDGLKPVQRRILYGAYEQGYMPNKKYVKNALIVGYIIGNLHPHGDSSVYDALVAMAQPWNYRYPLIDFHGNKGNYDGDSQAAMRYTEGRLNEQSLLLLEDIDYKCVDFKPNYAETMEEPVLLPSLLPNLIVNGASGIATGYTTNIPSHQLGEVIDGIIEVINNPNTKLEQIMKHIKGPDFPTGGCLVVNDAIKDLYQTGKSSLTFKGKYLIEENSANNNPQIVFYELPPETNKPKLVEKLHELCVDKKTIPRVLEIRDESEANDIRVVIELHKTAIVELVIKDLFAKTQLQKNITYILRAIVGDTPKMLTLKEMIQHYISHRYSVVKRRTQCLLDQTKSKLHIQEGLKIVSLNIRKAIDIIEKSETTEEARNGLMSFFKISEIQANHVLEIKLRQLTKLNKKQIEDLLEELKAKILEYENIISNQTEIHKIIIKELKAMKKDFNDERKTELIGIDEINEVAETQSDEPIALVLTSKNAVKHLTAQAFNDMLNKGTLRERTEVYIQGVDCKMSDKFALILDTGEYVKVDFNDLMGNFSFLENKQKVVAIVVIKDDSKEKQILVMTKDGLVKKVPMDGLRARNKRVAPLLELVNGDKIIGVKVIDTHKDNVITIITKDGVVHRFFEQSFKDTSAGGKGISGITMEAGNEVVAFDVTKITDDEKNVITLFSLHDDEKYGMKAMPLSEFKPKGRTSKGVRAIDYYKKQPGVLDNMVIASEEFFVLDKKGNCIDYDPKKLTLSKPYGKPEPIDHDIFIAKFFLD